MTDMTIVGIFIAIAGNLLSSCGVIFQKKSIDDNNCVGADGNWRQPLWLLGLALVCLASIMDFLALGFAEVHIVAILATTHIIFNAPLAAWILGEGVTLARYMTVGIIALGSFMAIMATEVVGGTSPPQLDSVEDVVDVLMAPRYYIYLIMCGCLGMIATIVMRNMSDTFEWLKYGWCLVASLFSSITVVTARLMLVSLTQGDFGDVTTFIVVGVTLVIVGFSSFIQISMVNISFAFVTSEVVTSCLFEASFVVTGIIASAVVLDEFRGMSAIGYVLFIAGCLINLACVIAVAREDSGTAMRLPEDIVAGVSYASRGAKPPSIINSHVL